MCNVYVKMDLLEKIWPRDLERPAEPLGKKNVKKYQIKLPPAVALFIHVPWKEVWDVVSSHCTFSLHLYRFGGNATSFTLTMAFIKMLLLLH